MDALKVKYLIVIFCAFQVFYAKAQTDTLVFLNGQTMTGEIKSMDRSVIIIETDYSDSDFKIEWDKLEALNSQRNYLITLSDGRRLISTISTSKKEDLVILEDEDGSKVNTTFDDIVFIKPLKGTFADRLSASVDLGYSLTKKDNVQQFSGRINLGYLAEKWSASGYYSSIFNSRDSVEDTRRNEANISFNIFLRNDWYVLVSNDFLQNDEQKLALRSTTKVGAGYYLVHSNTKYFGLGAGLAMNNENYTDEADPSKTSGEAFIGADLNLFNMGDLSLATNLFAYPSFTESGRVRVDFKFDIKYDLPLDFYINLGYSLNFDNQPVAGASTTDYVLQTSFGWEL